MAAFIDDILSLLDPDRPDGSAQAGAHGIEKVEPADIPEPYHSLLVHERDMTGTLGAFWKSKIELQQLLTNHDQDSLYRQVALLAVERGIPVEAGAIRIFLNRFPLKSLPRIIQGQTPLGAILADDQIPYHSSPQGYFRITTNRFLREVFGDVPAGLHYGRRNRLFDPAGEVLAEVVEILPLVGRR